MTTETFIQARLQNPDFAAGYLKAALAEYEQDGKGERLAQAVRDVLGARKEAA